MPRRLDLARQAMTAAAAAAQAALPALAGERIAENAGEGDSLVEPAGWAFAIWGPIYGVSSAYAVYQALPARRESALLRRAGWPLAAAFAGDAVWEALVIAGRRLAPQVVIVEIAGAANLALRRVARAEREASLRPVERWVVALPAGLLAGWTSAAAAISLAGLVEEKLLHRRGAREALAAGTLAGWAGRPRGRRAAGAR